MSSSSCSEKGPSGRLSSATSGNAAWPSACSFLGGGSRDDVLELFRAADGSLLSSAWENFPHTVVEALAVGTPVIATAVGGVPEIVRDGQNGLLVAPHDVVALGERRREVRLGRRVAEAPGEGGRPVGRGIRPGVPARTRRSRAREGDGGPPVRRLLMVGRTRYTLPLDPSLARKFDALGAQLDVRVLAARPAGARGRDPRFRLYGPAAPGRLEGAAFWFLLPFRVARELRSWRPDAVLSQGGQETALVLLGRALSGVSDARDHGRARGSRGGDAVVRLELPTRARTVGRPR